MKDSIASDGSNWVSRRDEFREGVVALAAKEGIPPMAVAERLIANAQSEVEHDKIVSAIRDCFRGFEWDIALIKELPAGRLRSGIINGLASGLERQDRDLVGLTPDIRTRVIKSTGALLDAEADKEFIKSLDEEVWIIMVSGAVQTNAPKAFELATWEIGEAYRRVACSEAARMWMVLDPMAASKRIGEMPRSSLKDVAVVEMVNHILSKDGAEAAKAWLGEISDPAIRKRMALRFNEP